MRKVRRRLGRRKTREGVGPPERKKGRKRGAKIVWRRAQNWAKGDDEFKTGRRKKERKRKERKSEREKTGREARSEHRRVRETAKRQQNRRNLRSGVV